MALTQVQGGMLAGSTNTTTTIQSNGTTAITIDTSQNVGIGTSSPSFGLTVVKDNGSGYVAGFRSAAGSPMLTIQNTGGISQIQGLNSALSATADIGLQVSGGNVGIGTSSPSSALHVSRSSGESVVQITNSGSGASWVHFSPTSGAAYLHNTGNTPMIFTTNGTERMRITSGGNLLVGTTTDSARLTVTGSGATGGTWSVYATNSTPTQTFGVRNDGAIYLGLAAASPYNNTTATAANCVLVNDGFTARSTSALKYKQDIRDLENININKFRPVRYKSKCINDDQTKDHFGIVADEVHEAGITELVNYGADGEIEGFQYERLTVVLLKAIQELNAKVEAQAAEIAALKVAK